MELFYLCIPKVKPFQVALCGDLPLVMPDSTSVGCRPALLCPAETRMIAPNSLTMPLVPERQLLEAEPQLTLPSLAGAHLAFLFIMTFAAEDQVWAIPHAIAFAETTYLIALSFTISGAAALDP